MSEGNVDGPLILPCPHAGCARLNPIGATRCEGCGTALETFARLYFLPASCFNHGLQAIRSGDFFQGEAWMRMAHRLDPKDPATSVVLGKLCAEQGQWDAAQEFWLDALEAAPTHAAALLCLWESKQLAKQEAKPSRKKGKKSARRI